VNGLRFLVRWTMNLLPNARSSLVLVSAGKFFFAALRREFIEWPPMPRAGLLWIES